MKLIEPTAEYLPQAIVPSGSPEGLLDELYKHIEKCARTCYKSENKITKGSAKPFVYRMIKLGHTAMLEHGTIYLYDRDWNYSPLIKYRDNKYSRYRDNYLRKETFQGNTEYLYEYFVTTNLRVLVERGWLDDLKYLWNPTEHHEMRYTFRMTTSIGVTRELNRHKLLCAA